MTIGGLVPTYINAPQDYLWLRWVAVALFGAAAIVAFLPRAQMRVPMDERSDTRPSYKQLLQLCAALIACTLLFPYIYSYAVRPIYVVARYDTSAFPSLLAMFAFGFARFIDRLNACLGGGGVTPPFSRGTDLGQSGMGGGGITRHGT